MVANPMQKMKRNSTLLGVVIGLMIAVAIGAVLYMLVLQPILQKGASEEVVTRPVAVLTRNIKSGEEITIADYTQVVVNSQAAPTDAIVAIDATNIVVSKIDLTAGTILSNNMLTTQDSKLTDDLREQEYNMISLPSELAAGDYIDIRLQLPDGGDYIVISKKYVQNANNTTIWLNMTEEETVILSNAIIEYYIMAGSKLYATIYTDPGTQVAAIPTYYPNEEVEELIRQNKNVKNAMPGRYTDALKGIRSSKINAQLREYSDSRLENIETNIQDEIDRLKQSREAYFGALSIAQ